MQVQGAGMFSFQWGFISWLTDGHLLAASSYGLSSWQVWRESFGASISSYKDISVIGLVPLMISVQFSSVTQSCLTLCDPIDCNAPGFPVHHQLPELTQSNAHWVGDAIQPSHPLSSPLLLPSIFPSIRIFSKESVLPIRWPKFWSFSLSISPSNECCCCCC